MYLSGPVTGRDWDEADAAFLDARRRLREAGAADCLVPTQVVASGTGHEDAMLTCIQYLTYFEYQQGRRERYFDLLVSLPGWETSDGARMERMVAEACGIPCAELAEVVGDG